MKALPIFFCVLYICLCGCLSAQVKEEVKTDKKSPGAFISIANDDISGSTLNVSVEHQLEKSYYAFGDKDIVQSMILCDLLHDDSSANDKFYLQDTLYLARISRCPKISKLRTADPFLVCSTILQCYVANANKGMQEGYNLFTKWQQENIPHCPIGENETPTSLNGQDKLIFDITNSRDWVLNYPKEFEIVLNYYNQSYVKWVASTGGQNISHAEFLLWAVKTVGFLDPGAFAQYFTDNYFSNPPKNFAIPSNKFMRTSTRQFIVDAYENLLLREPDDSEINGLSEIINSKPDMKPETFYYALMMSVEYKYY